MELYRKKFNKDIVIAGFLHDLLEDTDVNENEIKKLFGKKILNLIKANSYNKKIKNEKERYKEMLCRCAEAGREAIIVKVIDILDNSRFYHLADKKKKKILLEKITFAVKQFTPQLKDNSLINEIKKYQNLKESLQV